MGDKTGKKSNRLVIHVFKQPGGDWFWEMRRYGRLVAQAGAPTNRSSTVRTLNRLIGSLGAENYELQIDKAASKGNPGKRVVCAM